MIGTFDYQERITICAQWAERAANDQAKGLWKDMERFWRQRATKSRPRSDAALVTDMPSVTDMSSDAELVSDAPAPDAPQRTPPDRSIS